MTDRRALLRSREFRAAVCGALELVMETPRLRRQVPLKFLRVYTAYARLLLKDKRQVKSKAKRQLNQ